MKTYRIFLLEQATIVTSLDFSIEDDDRACRAAAVVFDACRDHCDECELWEGARLIATGDKLKVATDAQATAAKADGSLVAESQEAADRIAMTILEAAIKISPALRAIPRLNARLEALRRAPD